MIRRGPHLVGGLLVVAVVCFAGQAAAEDEPGASRPGQPTATATGDVGALQKYRALELSVRYSFWQGLKLERQGQVVDLGFFGGNARTFFGTSPAAMDSMGRYRAMRIAGTTLWTTGVAVLLTQLVMLAAQSDVFTYSSAEGGGIKPLFWGMLIPAAVVGLTGGLLMQGANGYLSDAVSQRNGDLAKRLRGHAPSGRTVGLTFRRAF